VASGVGAEFRLAQVYHVEIGVIPDKSECCPESAVEKNAENHPLHHLDDCFPASVVGDFRSIAVASSSEQPLT